MLQGMIGGALTLLWAVALFLLLVYVVAVLCRLWFGHTNDSDIETVYPYFDTVPRSMFTIFRCSFGDCSSSGGLPIAEAITTYHGSGFAILYSGFVFFVTIGLFNVISAIFVESTMTAAAKISQRNAQKRLNDWNRLAINIAKIIKELIAAKELITKQEENSGITFAYKTATLHGNDDENNNSDESLDSLDSYEQPGERKELSKEVDDIVHYEFSRDLIDHAVGSDDPRGTKIREALRELDIDKHDYKRLSDILDPDHSGTIGMLELAEGLRRLRGETRRSDVVAIDLMMRAVQDNMDATNNEIMEILTKLDANVITLVESMPIQQQAGSRSIEAEGRNQRFV